MNNNAKGSPERQSMGAKLSSFRAVSLGRLCVATERTAATKRFANCYLSALIRQLIVVCSSLKIKISQSLLADPTSSHQKFDTRESHCVTQCVYYKRSGGHTVRLPMSLQVGSMSLVLGIQDREVVCNDIMQLKSSILCSTSLIRRLD